MVLEGKAIKHHWQEVLFKLGFGGTLMAPAALIQCKFCASISGPEVYQSVLIHFDRSMLEVLLHASL